MILFTFKHIFQSISLHIIVLKPFRSVATLHINNSYSSCSSQSTVELLKCNLFLWKRYLDDIFCLFKGSLNYLFMLNECSEYLSFTMDYDARKAPLGPSKHPCPHMAIAAVALAANVILHTVAPGP